MSFTRWLSWVDDALRTRLWPVPLIAVLLAIAAGVGLPILDERVANGLTRLRWILASSAEDAREVLGTISTALMTVTSLTFSLTVVTLQLASGQYSPRLLRTFARDRFVQRTLALFLATFAYSLTLLHNVPSKPSDGSNDAPQLAVSLAVVLALSSVVGLVFFLAHLVTEIRVETMMRTVWADSRSVADKILEVPDLTVDDVLPPQPPTDAQLVHARSTGFIVKVDEQSVAATASKVDAVVIIHRACGQWLIAGEPLAHVWPLVSGAELGDEHLEELAESLAASVHTGKERTPIQDIGYGLRQLTDVAVKALSPAINDPTTAVHALGYSSALLCELAKRRLDYGLVSSGDTLRVVARRPTFAELLELAIAQPRLYGGKDAALLARIFALLSEVAYQTDDAGRQAAISAQLARLRWTVSQHDFDQHEQDELAELGRHVEAVLAGDWRPHIARAT